MTGARLGRAGSVFLASVALVGCSSTPAPSPGGATSEASLVPSEAPSPSAAATESPEPSPSLGPVVYAALDGLTGDPASLGLLPIAVMIDDNAVARPQSGFNAASIVYQAPADGGEDRYMLVFQELVGPDIGPVRSGRPYFVNWAAEYRAGFAHYGGDEKTRFQVIPSLNGTLIFNLDALAGADSGFHRISTRVAPHNAYTSTDDLRATAHRLGWPAQMASGVALRPFKDDAPQATWPASGSISVPYNTGTVGYTYDPTTNAYLRSVMGRPQLDPVNGARVIARDVVVLFMTLSIDPQSEPGYARPVLGLIGSGRSLVFRDGSVVVGTWRKSSTGDLTRFYDAHGQEVALDRGRIFIQVVPIGTNVTYKAIPGAP